MYGEDVIDFLLGNDISDVQIMDAFQVNHLLSLLVLQVQLL